MDVLNVLTNEELDNLTSERVKELRQMVAKERKAFINAEIHVNDMMQTVKDLMDEQRKNLIAFKTLQKESLSIVDTVEEQLDQHEKGGE